MIGSECIAHGGPAERPDAGGFLSANPIESSVMVPASAYIVAARRTALGRVGGLHRQRRLEELAAPVVAAVLGDCGVAPARVDELIVGNASQGGNPARVIALAAGLPESVSAATIDRQCGSGLDAILAGVRAVAAGDAEVIVAGGAESLSTAPWRIAKPKSLYQTPHFIGVEPGVEESSEDAEAHEAMEELARQLGISRAQQDAWAARSHLRAAAAREARRFIGEIVPIRANPEEMRDQSAVELTLEDLSRLAPFVPPDGRLTPGNTAAMHDGAAFVVVVSEKVWNEIGRPRAMRLVASATQGVGPGREATAPIEAMKKLYGRLNGFNPKDIGVYELGESSAAQAIAFGADLGVDDDHLNPEGGALVRGQPLGAAGAVLVVRLFSHLVRHRGESGGPNHGVVALGALGGMGLAALFEAV